MKTESDRHVLISDLISTEFSRVNKGVEITVEIMVEIKERSREAHDALYGSEINSRNVVVVGSDLEDTNGRKGVYSSLGHEQGPFHGKNGYG